MIKKFEEFVNESVSPSLKNKSHSWRETLTSEDVDKLTRIFADEFGLERKGAKWGSMMRIISKANGIYTFEEITEILYKLKSAFDTHYGMHLLKILFDEGESVQAKQKELDYFSKKNNGGIPVPVVVDINGKLITGEVYYCEALDAYAKDEDDFIEDGYAWLEKKCAEEGIYDNGQTDGLNDYWDWLNIDTVNLDEEYFDRKQNLWVKRK